MTPETREVDGAVEATEQRGLARLGGADDAEDFVALDVEGNAVNNLLVAIGKAQVPDNDLGVGAHGRGQRNDGVME